MTTQMMTGSGQRSNPRAPDLSASILGTCARKTRALISTESRILYHAHRPKQNDKSLGPTWT